MSMTNDQVTRYLFNPARNRILLLHVFCWSLFILYELCFLYYTQVKFSAASVITFLCYYFVNIGVFYSQLYLLNRTFHQRGNYFAGLLLFILQLVIFMLLKAALDIIFAEPVRSVKTMTVIVKTYLFVNAFRGIYFAIYATIYWIAGNIAGYRKQASLAEKKRLVAQKDKAEIERRLSDIRNAYLQQQLNPHLLFNSLSFIYSSVYPHSAEASESVLLLADIMRFSLDSSNGDGKTAVAAEMKQVDNLIKLNRYRFHHDLCLQTQLETVPDDLRVIPLVLLTLTENIFKHGVLNDPARPALLHVRVDTGGQLTYYSRNYKKTKSTAIKRTSLGLQNIRIRLGHSYPGNHILNIEENDALFELKLILTL